MLQSETSLWELTDDQILKELGVAPILPKAPARDPKWDRALRVFHDARAFHEAHGRPPSPKSDDLGEEGLANRFKAVAENPKYVEILLVYDSDGLIESFNQAEAETDPDEMSDIEILQSLGVAPVKSRIQTLSHVRHSSVRNAPDEIGRREPCQDFERYRPLFKTIHQELDAGQRKTILYVDLKEKKIDQIREGVFFVVGGQTAFVAKVGETYRHHGWMEAKIKIVFDNGTQANLLRSSLLRALWKDTDSRLITEPHIMGDRLDEGDVVTGRIYVVRSESNHPLIAEHRDALHKIGFTSRPVRKRLEGVETDPTFLLAKVELIETYELVGLDGKNVERALHDAFASARVNFHIPDRFGNPFQPREWFLVPPHIIAEAVDLARKRALHLHTFDVKRCEIVPVG